MDLTRSVLLYRGPEVILEINMDFTCSVFHLWGLIFSWSSIGSLHVAYFHLGVSIYSGAHNMDISCSALPSRGSESILELIRWIYM